MTISSPSAHLKSILTPTDHLRVSKKSTLTIDGCDAVKLLQEFGSPLYVVSENTLRANYRKIHKALADRWPAPINVMYAIKANNTPAVRRIVFSEGAGGDCFGLGELYATFAGGADPGTIAMNGNYKSYEELTKAVEHGVCINIDSVEEIDDLHDITAKTGKTVNVNLRLKITPESFNALGSDYFGISENLGRFIEEEKWGFSFPLAVDLVKKITQTPGLKFCGYTTHSGRFTRDPEQFSEYMAEFARMVIALVKKTDVPATLINLGGGWPRQRDPEARTYSLNEHPIEDYVSAITGKLLNLFKEADIDIPELWLEPGRYLSGNAGVLLGTVGAVKEDVGMQWVTVDFSTNNVMRIDTSGSKYHVLAAERMDRQLTEKVDIVGPTCTWSLIASDWMMPKVRRGEAIAVLDVGMYAETASTQFNGVPRPATVLVADGTAEIVKERESVQDVFHKCRMPERLRKIMQ